MSTILITFPSLFFHIYITFQFFHTSYQFNFFHIFYNFSFFSRFFFPHRYSVKVNVTADDNGAVFTCQADNHFGTTTHDAITLSILCKCKFRHFQQSRFSIPPPSFPSSPCLPFPSRYPFSRCSKYLSCLIFMCVKTSPTSVPRSGCESFIFIYQCCVSVLCKEVSAFCELCVCVCVFFCLFFIVVS